MTDKYLLAQALKALELEDMACRYEKEQTPSHIANLITALRERLKQPEQEPVAWKDMAFARLGVVRDKMHPDDVKTIQRFLDGDYTTPPQRKPLTDPQIHEFDWPDGVSFEDILQFVRAIEAAHGIREEA